MSKKALVASKGVRVTDLFKLIPDSLFEDLAEEIAVDKWVKKLKAEAVFKLVLFSLLDSERLSLRVLEGNTRDPAFRSLYHSLSAHEVTWVGIRERLIHLSPTYCRRLYETVYEQAQTLYGEKNLGKYHIKRYDSTMIASFSHLLEGMRVGNTKKGKTQAKLTTELIDDFQIQMYVHTDQTHVGEEIALKEAILQGKHTPEDIIVFDRGIKSRRTFAQFDDKGIGFVSRLSAKPRYKLLHAHKQEEQTPGLTWIQDSVVFLYPKGNKVLEHKMRLIQYRVHETGQVLSFVTNLWDLPASVIAQIYRSRWDIEVLFRFMKQEMNLTHFVCNNSNAIEVMLYFTMITAMLVLIYKKQNGIRSYKMAKIQFFKELIYSVMLEILDSPEGIEIFRHNMKTFIQKE
ncbi:MAG: IS4 family transposase [Rhodothermales bacterium]